ncbi:hypothetical protein CQA44_11445 [Helicobacter sp. MIT 14-3879]|nr:hypothetical protein CQA44_11445 [Helicobacter sp. MIT 14-3879]
MYFSYGDDEIRLNDTSKHYKDINLHIITRNCRDNEEIEIVLESSNHQNFTAYGRVKDNKAVIKNIFKDI